MPAQPPEQPSKLFLIDKHPATREGLFARVQQELGLQFCGQTGELSAALPLIAETRPDVVILDVAQRGGSGLELLKRIREAHPAVRALVWSRYREAVYADRVIRAGALGYIEKLQPTEKVVEAIRHVAAGKVYLSSEMTNALLSQAGGLGGNFDDPVAALSDRELEVFRMIGLGHDTQRIAVELQLSHKTVETYRGRIKTKFSLDSSAELLRLAVQWELENG